MGSCFDHVQPGGSEGGDDPGLAPLGQAGQEDPWRLEPPVLLFCNSFKMTF